MRLNNKNLTLDDQSVRGTTRFKSEELAGNTSSTATANNGIKPKLFTVSGLISFANADVLNSLIELSEATDSNGAMAVYNVVQHTINTAKVSKVQFSDSVSYSEYDGLAAWRIQYSVKEVVSKAEKVEIRRVEETPATDETALPINPVIEAALAGDPLDTINLFAQSVDNFNYVLKPDAQDSGA